MSDEKPLDYEHLLEQARLKFPGRGILVTHAADEIIHVDVDGHRFTFEIGSDDDAYVFTDGKTAFTIPLLESDEEI